MTAAQSSEKAEKLHLPIAAKRLRVINRTRGTVLAGSVQLAGTSAERTRGLLGRDGLAPDEGLWIIPCESVHTFGMRFAIDLIYLDRKYRIRKIRHSIKPWRLSVCLIAHSVLELPAGSVCLTGSQVGDTLELIETDDPNFPGEPVRSGMAEQKEFESNGLG